MYRNIYIVSKIKLLLDKIKQRCRYEQKREYLDMVAKW